MGKNLSLFFNTARSIGQLDGPISFLSRGLAHLVRYFFQYETYYLYKHTIYERDEADFLPKIKNFTTRIVTSNQQADELAAEGLDFRSYVFYARRSLDRGAIAFCIFVDRELAHVAWVAMTKEAKKDIDPLPFQVDFANREACTGGTRTIRKYRGKGLMTYSYWQRFDFLKKKGVIATRNSVATSNIASQRVHTRFNPELYAKARYLKILRWKSWKEMPMGKMANRK